MSKTPRTHCWTHCWIVVFQYVEEAWYVINEHTREVVTGPHDTFAEAESAAKDLVIRMRKGWPA